MAEGSACWKVPPESTPPDPPRTSSKLKGMVSSTQPLPRPPPPPRDSDDEHQDTSKAPPLDEEEWLASMSSMRVGTLDSIASDIGTGSWTVGALRQMGQDPEQGEEGDAMGSPAPRRHHDERTDEEVARRDSTMKKVADMSSRYCAELKNDHLDLCRRKNRRTKTAPNLQYYSEDSNDTASQVVGTAEDQSATLVSSVSAAGISKSDNEPVIVFDWDDTLFPTWYITEVVQIETGTKDSQQPEPLTEDSPYFAPLAAHAKIMVATLELAAQVGRVAIVTLARRPWVENSVNTYMPGLDINQLFQDLEVDVFYAREHIKKGQAHVAQLEDGVNLFMIAKRNAMKALLKKVYGKNPKRPLHILGIGDSTAEQDAMKEVIWCYSDAEDNLCKTVKLMTDPSLEHLSHELNVLIGSMDKMIESQKDFDVSMETAAGIERIQEILAQ
eukprot:TRINITY_DN98743_c0_g1_i1.p1 TRINITY_DN98743_c0_g1~~TRINITY_DN98743_c0_g1_i1.p1  ORF type:complete len:442 (-),score=89.44 TRINITY_DN98743_c0_g1_i1:154-1479(-)